MTATENAGPTAGEISDPMIIATVDGKRFGVRDPATDEAGIVRSFGEAPWVLGPMLNFFGEEASTLWCVEGSAVGMEEVLQRAAILLRCTEYDAFDAWVDRETGLVLRQVPRVSDEEPGWFGFVEIEFDPSLDPSLFDPQSV